MTAQKKQIAIGVDVGGSHISCKSYDLNNKKLVKDSLKSMEINNGGSADEIVTSFIQLLQPCLSEMAKEEIAGIGLAMPGPFDYKNGIAMFSGENAKYSLLNGVDMRKALATRLGIEENKIRFINDATAFAIGEYFNGQLQGAEKALAITLGTGFGSAFLWDGKPVISDNTVPEGGVLWNEPFADGIADDYFSTRGLISRFSDQSGVVVEGVKPIAELYNTNSHSKDVFDDFGTQLAVLLSPWLKRFDVENLVIGGNISKAFSLFEGSFITELDKEGIKIKVAPSILLEDAAFVGAASLMNDQFYNSIEEQLEQM